MIHYKKYNKFLFYTHKIDKYEFVEYFNPEDYLLAKHNFARFWYYLSKVQRLKWIEISGCDIELYDDYNKLIRYVYEISIEEFDKIFFRGCYCDVAWKRDFCTNNVAIFDDQINKLYYFKHNIVLFWLSLKNEEKEKLINLINTYQFINQDIIDNDNNNDYYMDFETNYYTDDEDTDDEDTDDEDTDDEDTDDEDTDDEDFEETDSTKNLSKEVTQVICVNKNIKKLNNLPESVTLVNCYNNYIKNLDNLPESLEILICSRNYIKKLDNLPNNIYELNCSNNPIERLENLPSNLKNLICRNTKITHLNNLPNKLEYLDIGNNNLEEVLNLPLSLEYLNISYSNISNINYPLNLKSLNCTECNSNLNNLHNLIEVIECSVNDLSKIVYYPNNLKLLYCEGKYDNKILLPFGLNTNELKCEYIHQY